MTDYKKLVKALRICADDSTGCGECPFVGKCVHAYYMDLKLAAADAIEALQAEVQFYKNLAEEWRETAERKERLLGMYRAQNIYSAKDASGHLITNLCYLNRSETPNSPENQDS